MVSIVQTNPSAHAVLSTLNNLRQGGDGRVEAQGQAGRSDAAELTRAGAAGDARAELDAALKVLDLALAAGREGAVALADAREAAKAGDDAAFQSQLGKFQDIIDSAIEEGAGLLAGENLSVALDGDGAPVELAGFDLRLKDQPGAEDVVRVSAAARGDEADLTRDLDASLARLDAALSKLSSASQKLSAHESFLAQLEGAVAQGVSGDLDAEGARLLALQVSQTLRGESASIANSAPQSLLALFRE